MVFVALVVIFISVVMCPLSDVTMTKSDLKVERTVCTCLCDTSVQIVFLPLVSVASVIPVFAYASTNKILLKKEKKNHYAASPG